MIELYSNFLLGSIDVNYFHDTISELIGLQILPAGSGNELAEHRSDISDQPENHFFARRGDFPAAYDIQPLVLISCAGDPRAGGFSQGQTMRGSKSGVSLSLKKQSMLQLSDGKRIDTLMCTPDGISVLHQLTHVNGSDYLICKSVIINQTGHDIELELLSSFAMGFISPFQTTDGSGAYDIHRFRSRWSAEALHVRQSAEELQLENSWCHHSVICERFGQVGSMPVRKWFPFAAVEDKDAHVTWGACIESPGSWQIEIFRQDDFLHLSGGLADREFGHWLKKIGPEESFTSSEAYISVVKGGITELCRNLLQPQEHYQQRLPGMKNELPVVFNEWCTSWGRPTASDIVELADTISDWGIHYFVIDAGWYADSTGNWENTQGDWNVSAELFPGGLKKVCDFLKSKGFRPGLWFEFEVVGCNAVLSKKHEWLLHRDGMPLRAGERFFLDFRCQDVRDYLYNKVIGLIKECGFEYLKIDYNETIGIGCDGAESMGEALRQHLVFVQDFIKQIKISVPDIVIENCSSGGHRLEPSFINLTSITSFSDAHETRAIPIIAANLQHLIITSKNLVWAVLHPYDSRQRLIYSLASTFLGCMCLSGELNDLGSEQRNLVKEAIKLYKKASAIITDGVSEHFGQTGNSYRHPSGWQAVVRYSKGRDSALAVIHSFENSPASFSIPLAGNKNWGICSCLTENGTKTEINKGAIQCKGFDDFSAEVLLLES